MRRVVSRIGLVALIVLVGVAWPSLTALLTAQSSVSGRADVPFSLTSAGTTEDEHGVKTTPGALMTLTATNTNAAARYLRCANATAANTTPGTTTPILDLALPAAGNPLVLNFGPNGLRFSVALTCWAVTGTAQSDVAEVAANEVKLLYTVR